MMKMLTKCLTGLAAVLLCGAAMADTFYLQADMPTNPDYPGQTDTTRWYTAAVGGTQMASNTPFAGNFFNPNGFTMKTSYDLGVGQDNLDTDVFPGTIVMDTAGGYYGSYVKTNSIAGIDWSRTGSRNDSFRNHQWADTVVTITNLNVTGHMVIRANAWEYNMDLHVPNLTGGGSIEFGTDSTETNSTWGLDIDNSSFSGTITIAVGDLRINDALVLNDTDLSIASGNSAVILSNNASFNSVGYGTGAIPVGTYTAAELNDETGTSNFSGPGSLTVLTDNSLTFYLHEAKPKGNAGHYESDQRFWWDDPVAGNNMTNVVGATFIGNRFELNGFDYNSWDGGSSLDSKRRFSGTLVKDDEKIQKHTKLWVLAGLHVTTNSVTGGNGIRLRDADTTLTVEDFKLDGLLRIQVNSDKEHNLDTTIEKLTGAGTLSFGDDNTIAEDGASIWGLDIDNSAFTGTIEINVGNLRFDDDLALTNATLSVQGGAQLTTVILSNNAAFAAMEYDGVSVADGEYTAAALNALTSPDRFSGTGLLTVGTPPPGLLYEDWVALYPTLGSLTNLTDDAENGGLGDGLNNLLEYALGGNPTNDDAAAVLPVSEADAGWLNLVYDKRADADNVGLTYTVVTDTDLVHGQMTNEVPVYGTSLIAIDGYVTATNRISTATDNQAFMQLKVELD